MIANWAVGKEACPFQVAEQLKVTPFDCVIITMTTAVAATTPIAKFFNNIASPIGKWRGSVAKASRVFENPLQGEIARGHTVFRLTSRVHVVVHRAKIT